MFEKLVAPTGQSLFKHEDSPSVSENDYRDYLDLKPEFLTGPGLASTHANRPKMMLEVSQSALKKRELAEIAEPS